MGGISKAFLFGLGFVNHDMQTNTQARILHKNDIETEIRAKTSRKFIGHAKPGTAKISIDVNALGEMWDSSGLF